MQCIFFGQKLRVVFTRGSFRKGVRVLIGVPGGGVWGCVQVGGFPVENAGKGEGVGEGGGGVGTGKGTGKSMRTLLSKLPLSKLPSSFSPNFSPKVPCDPQLSEYVR